MSNIFTNTFFFFQWNRGTLTKWIAINCSRCGNSLGEGQYCQEGDDTVLLSVKLYKYCVNIKPEVSEKPTFIDFFLSDLINIAKVHATPRFIIQGQQSHTPYALVSQSCFVPFSLFNCECSCGYSIGIQTSFITMVI